MIVSEIVQSIKDACGPDDPAFVRYDQNAWYEVQELVAREKVGSILRDSLSHKYSSSTKAKLEKRKHKREQQKIQKHQQEGKSSEDRKVSPPANRSSPVMSSSSSITRPDPSSDQVPSSSDVASIPPQATAAIPGVLTPRSSLLLNHSNLLMDLTATPGAIPLVNHSNASLAALQTVRYFFNQQHHRLQQMNSAASSSNNVLDSIEAPLPAGEVASGADLGLENIFSSGSSTAS